jgi:hypothetical protein
MLPALLAGDFTALWILLGLMVFGEVFLRLAVWFSKLRTPVSKGSKGTKKPVKAD